MRASFLRCGQRGSGNLEPKAVAKFSSQCFQTLASEPAFHGAKVDYRTNEKLQTSLSPAHFVTMLKNRGTGFFTGVPDSLLKDLCWHITDNVSSKDHVIAANEGTALATAAGHHLATGRIPAVYLQNSGLGNLVNPLLSLCSSKVYSIPVLMIIGWRGEPGTKDEPQHVLQGKLTASLLTEMGVSSAILPDYHEGASQVVERAYAHMSREKAPFALLVKKKTFEKYTPSPLVTQQPNACPETLHREPILDLIASKFQDAAVVSTTGYTSRELFELRAARGQPHEQDFYTVGSMGHSSSIALGIAASQTNKQVVCIDGDGAALMHMGALATAGKSGLRNFKHILINNGMHDSVGGQPTGAENIDFAAIARACGYRSAARARSESEVCAALAELKEASGPCFLEIAARSGARSNLGRPTTTTHENREAFMSMMRRSS
mmetsp:Transcript_48009/g.104504  ORF Transcript_48009/g.104504 Transcript_48009/m.104504 type:complete len:435 (+) Transcript_48009:41-1345(+)